MGRKSEGAVPVDLPANTNGMKVTQQFFLCFPLTIVLTSLFSLQKAFHICCTGQHCFPCYPWVFITCLNEAEERRSALPKMKYTLLYCTLLQSCTSTITAIVQYCSHTHINIVVHEYNTLHKCYNPLTVIVIHKH